MAFIDLGLFGQLHVAPPQRTVRAFGSTPYVRVLPVPHFDSRALATRLGSFYLWAIQDPRPRRPPLAAVVELRLVPGYMLRTAWLRAEGLVLRSQLFPGSGTPSA